MPFATTLARREGLSGAVAVEFEVDEKGRVRDPEVVLACPLHTFDTAALGLIRRTTYDATQFFRGARYMQVIQFVLADDPAVAPALSRCQKFANEKGGPVACVVR